MIIFVKIVFLIIIIRAIILAINLWSTKTFMDLEQYIHREHELHQIEYKKIVDNCHGNEKMFRSCMIICTILVIIFICVMAFVGGAL